MIMDANPQRDEAFNASSVRLFADKDNVPEWAHFMQIVVNYMYKDHPGLSLIFFHSSPT